MLLPSGPANTRCSVCRFDPGGLHVQLRPAPGTGLQSPETGSQNRRYRDLSRRQRPHVPHLNPRKCPQIAGYSSETAREDSNLQPDRYERSALTIELRSAPVQMRARNRAALAMPLTPATYMQSVLGRLFRMPNNRLKSRKLFSTRV